MAMSFSLRPALAKIASRFASICLVWGFETLCENSGCRIASGLTADIYPLARTNRLGLVADSRRALSEDRDFLFQYYDLVICG